MDDEFPASPPKILGRDVESAGRWTYHRALATNDGAVAFTPAIPLGWFGSLHLWSEELGQWVRPTLFNPKAGQTWASRPPT